MGACSPNGLGGGGPLRARCAAASAAAARHGQPLARARVTGGALRQRGRPAAHRCSKCLGRGAAAPAPPSAAQARQRQRDRSRGCCAHHLRLGLGGRRWCCCLLLAVATAHARARSAGSAVGADRYSQAAPRRRSRRCSARRASAALVNCKYPRPRPPSSYIPGTPGRRDAPPQGLHSCVHYTRPALLPAHFTHARGVWQASSRSASRLPGAGFWSYSQRAVSGRLIRMLSMRPPVFRPNVVPRSYTRLNST